MRRLLFALVAIVAAAPDTNAQQADCSGGPVRISRERLLFSFDSLPGWLFDCNAGRADTLLVVFYQPSTERRGLTLMYANVLNLDSARAESSDDGIANDVTRRRRSTPDMTVVAHRDLRTKSGAPVIVREFKSQTKNLFELVGYVRGESAVAVLGLRARDQRSFDRSLADFERLVQAYTPAPTSRPP